jgi:hypothetical protein
MTDYQRLVDELRLFVAGNDLTQTDALTELSRAYTDACREANQRLRRCEDFLTRGLRSEAVQFAESEQPKLLDLVTLLDFPERTLYEQTLTFYGLPMPPRLMQATAEALNQAYAEVRPLEDLLRRHRRLALGRASLQARLAVMREIARLDGQNSLWSDDIREIELGRFRQMDREVSEAATSQPDRFSSIATELETTPWLTPPPAHLSKKVSTRARDAVRTQARVDLAVIARNLTRAMNASNLAEALTLRDRYRGCLLRAELPATDPTVLQAQQALQWLVQTERRQAQEFEFQTALADLEAALDEEADDEEVISLYHHALEHRRKLPGPLKQRYHEYVQRASRSRSWREKVILLSVFFVGAVLLALLIGFMRLKEKSLSIPQNSSPPVQSSVS